MPAPRLSVPALFIALAVSLATTPLAAQSAGQPANPNPVPKDPSEWPQHSMERPKPPVEVAPAQRLPVAPPAGAIVLFDGTNLNWWEMGNGEPAAWRLVDGAMEVVKGSGGIRTRVAFGDVRLHVEWASPNPAEGTGQDRGNSGVFLMSTYEVQVLDSYRADTYSDGQAGSIYGQFPPRVNVSRAPGEWQSYDIEFRRPRFDDTGALISPARLTVRHNGVLVHDDVALLGPTTNRIRAPYRAHADALPISLQDHGHPVRFRNIWAVPLEK